MPEKLPLKQARKRPLRYENIDHLLFNVCINPYRDEDAELLHKLPNEVGSFTEPLGELKLKDDTVPCKLPGCPSYYSSTSAISINV